MSEDLTLGTIYNMVWVADHLSTGLLPKPSAKNWLWKHPARAADSTICLGEPQGARGSQIDCIWATVSEGTALPLVLQAWYFIRAELYFMTHSNALIPSSLWFPFSISIQMLFFPHRTFESRNNVLIISPALAVLCWIILLCSLCTLYSSRTLAWLDKATYHTNTTDIGLSALPGCEVVTLFII